MKWVFSITLDYGINIKGPVARMCINAKCLDCSCSGCMASSPCQCRNIFIRNYAKCWCKSKRKGKEGVQGGKEWKKRAIEIYKEPFVSIIFFWTGLLTNFNKCNYLKTSRCLKKVSYMFNFFVAHSKISPTEILMQYSVVAVFGVSHCTCSWSAQLILVTRWQNVCWFTSTILYWIEKPGFSTSFWL